MPFYRLGRGALRRISLAWVLGSVALAQDARPQPPSPQQSQPEKTVSEISSRDEQTTFRSRVNLVMVPVVVRDAKGRTNGELKQSDFQLFDRGKPQPISRFSVEKSGSQSIKFADNEGAPIPEKQRAEEAAPNRFIGYIFDDVHASFGDLARARDAAIHHIEKDLGPADRAAIFTTSGQTNLDFTDDRDTLKETLMRLQPRPIARSNIQECPDLSYYMSDMIINKNDQIALNAATADALACGHMDPTMAQAAAEIARATAQRLVAAGDQETRVAFSVLRDAIRRMAAAPGQRILLLASPGFLSWEQSQEKSDVMDRAIRASVTINSLDIRGLYVDSQFDASRPSSASLSMQRIKAQYDRESARAEGDTLAELAYGTGGTAFENNNDLGEGFRRGAAAPEFYYLLGFSPQNLKLDGSFHNIKVALKAPAHLDLQARRGYYAPKRLNDAAENAKQEIEEALFSREELRELPVELHTQFFKADNGTANVTVLAHLDIKRFRFKKADGRNNNEVTVVSGLFDRNGTLVQGISKLLTLHLKDETLDKKIDNGFTIRTSFNVKPGTYLVRLVVRDTEGQMISAENSAVDVQ
jgi:VWFA-related protein